MAILSTILTALTLHDLACSAIGAAVYALLSTIFSRLARQIRRQRHKWYKSSPEYRNRQALLRRQSRERMSAIMAETDDPWVKPDGVRK